MLFFTKEIYDLEEAKYFPAEIQYEMEDIGVNMRRNEKLRPVLKSVVTRGRDILEELDEDTLAALRDEAAGHWQDEKDLARFGGEYL